jgi:transglutaminase-like putative cysteine protease
LSLLKNKFHISAGQEILPDRQALFALVIAFLLSISPHAGRLPAWFAVLAIMVFAWRYKIISIKGHQPGRLIRFSILFLVVFFLFKHYHTLLGRDAGVAMLIALTMLKFLELKSLRDYMLVVFLCLFIVLTSFLYSQSLWLGFYLLAVVIILFTVMMYLNHRARHDLLGMLKRAAKMVMIGLPVAVLLFLLFPRLQGGLFGLPGDSHSGLTGMSDTMEPGSINELNLSEKVAFRVEFAALVPVAKQRYWRGLVLENYQQGTWKESRGKHEIAVDIRYSTDDVIEYSILQEATNKKWIFALDMPVSKPVDLQWGTGQTLRSTSSLRERQQQDLKSAIFYAFADMSDAELARNMDTSSVTGERIIALAQGLYRQSGSDKEYINTVLAYFKNNDFIYSLQPPLLGENPVESFMLDTRKGYCEHYASSFTMMMRLAGVPARVVIGYQGGEWNEQGEYMIVRQSDAHAWSEVWLDERGWVRIDPTSAVAPERIEYGLSAVRQLMRQGQELGNLTDEKLQIMLQMSLLRQTLKGMKMFWDGVNTRWYKWVVGFGKENQTSILKWLGFKQANWSNLIFILVALVTMVVSIQAWMLFHRRKVLDPAVRQYQKFCHRLSRIGIARAPSEGPADFARRVIKLRPDLKMLVISVTEAYIAILYAGNTDSDQQQKLTRAVRDFRPKMLKL